MSNNKELNMSEITYDSLKEQLKKLDTIDHNVLALMSRVEALDGKMLAIIEKSPEGGIKIEGEVPVTPSVPKHVIAKHMEVGIQYLGMHEVKDNKVLTAFLGIDPNKIYWCAYYATACYDNAGMDSLGGVAYDYVDILKNVNEPYFGCACIWKNHIAFFYGYADETKLGLLPKYGKVNSLEEWEIVKCEAGDPNAVPMVLGGNHSDMCNISPKSFYDNYTEFDGYYEHAA